MQQTSLKCLLNLLQPVKSGQGRYAQHLTDLAGGALALQLQSVHHQLLAAVQAEQHVALIIMGQAGAGGVHSCTAQGEGMTL